MKYKFAAYGVAAILSGGSGPTRAHVALDQPQVETGSIYKAAVRIGHGCDGSPTHTVTVQVPVGFRGVKPLPKAGWTLAVRKEKLAIPYDAHGRTISEDVVEVSWQAGSPEAWLQDAWYDEFVMRGEIVANPGPMWFRVRQICDKGQWDWSEIPASGISTKGLKAPAAVLEVKPAVQPEVHAH